MYYFKRFDTYENYLIYKNSDSFIAPNLSIIDSDGKTYYTPYYNHLGDIVLHNGKRYFTVPSYKLQNIWNSNIYTVEGIVVVPNTHTPDGTTRFMSLVSMDYNNPENGNNKTNVSICRGGYGTSEFENSINIVKTTDNAEEPTYSSDYRGYLPTDFFTAGSMYNASFVSTINSELRYAASHTNLIESPFLSDGSSNPNYLYGTLGDLDGAGNTEQLLKYATSEDWKNADVISNLGTAGYYPAAETCKRYHTEHTSNWYLPSAGELGYMMCRLKEINKSIFEIRCACGEDKALYTMYKNMQFLSSNERYSTYAYALQPMDGYLQETSKKSEGHVRAFASANIQFGL